MKKNFKLVLALVLALTLFASMTAAMAATITVNTTGTNITNSHVYKAYALFTGDVDGTTLSNVQWGAGIDHAALFTDINANASDGLKAIFTSLSTADLADAGKVAKAISGLTTSAELTKEFVRFVGAHKQTAANATASNPINDLAPGYYLINDETTLSTTVPDAKSAFIMQVLGDEDITIKTDVPSVEKKIIEGSTAVDQNNKKIGDHVAYEITGTIPDHSAYDYYFFILNDDMSTGLTYDENAVVYKAEPNTGADKETKPYNDEVLLSATAEAPALPDYYLYTGANADGHTFQVALRDAKSLPVGTKIIVRFSGTLNENAQIGETGNPNKSTLIYSNNPNNSGEGNKDNDKPGKPKSTATDVTGTTPEDVVVTYTSQLTILKVDDKQQALAGAEFTITGSGKTTHIKGTQQYVEVAEGGTHYKLYNNQYTTEAPIVSHMAQAEAGATEGYVIDNTYTKSDKRVYGETTYRPYVADKDVGKTVYIEVLGNTDRYVSTEKKYKLETVTTTNEETFTINEVLTVGADGTTHTIQGLPAGTYTIEETKVPAGYNKVENKTLVIVMTPPESVTTGTEKATWSIGSSSSEGWTMDTAASANYKITIQNLAGSTLPSTGGVGTTIFYVAGSILVLAAAILLITKRRMSTND